MLGTLADAYANPIMVNGLMSGREGTMVPDDSGYAMALPTIGNADQLERWEPWVRAFIGVGELREGVEISFGANSVTVSRAGNQIIKIGRPSIATFVAQLPLVRSWGALRAERANEILAQIDPQYAFWSSIINMHPDRNRRTFELINIVLQLCVYIEMHCKHALGCWRPSDLSPQVQPMITTPGHGSFPMGHATQAYAVVQILKALLSLNPGKPIHRKLIDQLERQAARIATNRVVAGVHFPVDSMAGRLLGIALGDYVIDCCSRGGDYMQYAFKSTGIDAAPTTDFNPFDEAQAITDNSFYGLANASTQVPVSSVLNHLWDKAQAEWIGRIA